MLAATQQIEPPAAAPTDEALDARVTLLVSDLARSVRFYRDVLGLAEIDYGPLQAVLASDDTRLVLRHMASATPPLDGRVIFLNMEVPDVHLAYERLGAQGVEFVHKPRAVHGERVDLWTAVLRDPDGHGIAITHWDLPD